MQFQKDNIRDEILRVSQELFLSAGYQKASMRDIAERVDISVSNLYNYFRNKDAIFCTIVEPVVIHFNNTLEEYHGNTGHNSNESIDNISPKQVLDVMTERYTDILRKYRPQLRLLLFQSQGTSLEHFKDEFTDRSTYMVQEWFARLKRRVPEAKTEISDFFVHINTVWLFTVIEEIISHNISDDDAKRIFHEYGMFQMLGWGTMLNVDPRWFMTRV